MKLLKHHLVLLPLIAVLQGGLSGWEKDTWVLVKLGYDLSVLDSQGHLASACGRGGGGRPEDDIYSSGGGV